MKAGDRVTLSEAGKRAGVLRIRQARGPVRGQVLCANARKGTVTVRVDGLRRELTFTARYWQRDA